MYSRKRRSAPARGEPHELDREIRAKLAEAAGGRLRGNDPVSSVSDNFRAGFDRIGRANAERLSAQRGYEDREGGSAPWHETAGPSERQSGQLPLPGTKSEGMYLRGYPASPVPLERFSDVAFAHGSLAGSILRGTGKMMLVSCLRRAVNPRRPEKHEYFRDNVTQKPFPGHDPDSMVFTTDLVRGAVSIVVDTLHESRRTVEMLAQAVERGGKGSEQLFAMYPFLDDSRERELLEQYRAELGQSPEVDRHALLQGAIVHTEALMEKKAETRLRFVTALRNITEHATAAIEEFEDPGFVGAVVGELTEEENEEVPPPDGPGRNRGRGRYVPEESDGDGDGAQRDIEPEQPDADALAEGDPPG